MGAIESIILGAIMYGGGAAATGTTAVVLSGIGTTTAVAGIVNLATGKKDNFEVGFESKYCR